MKLIYPTTLCLAALTAARRQTPLGNPNHDGLAITVRATPTVSHVAEIAQIELVLSATGTNDAAASASASNADVELRDLLKSYDGAIEKWTATQLTSGKQEDDHEYFRRCRGKDCDSSSSDDDGKEKEVSASYSLTFTDLQRLSTFSTEIEELIGVKIDRVEWKLTEGVKKTLRAEMRLKAVEELGSSANDYKEALGLESVKPVDLHEEYFYSNGWRHRRGDMSRLQDFALDIPKVEMEAEVSCKFLTS